MTIIRSKMGMYQVYSYFLFFFCRGNSSRSKVHKFDTEYYANQVPIWYNTKPYLINIWYTNMYQFSINPIFFLSCFHFLIFEYYFKVYGCWNYDVDTYLRLNYQMEKIFILFSPSGLQLWRIAFIVMHQTSVHGWMNPGSFVS